MGNCLQCFGSEDEKEERLLAEDRPRQGRQSKTVGMPFPPFASLCQKRAAGKGRCLLTALFLCGHHFGQSLCAHGALLWRAVPFVASSTGCVCELNRANGNVGGVPLFWVACACNEQSDEILFGEYEFNAQGRGWDVCSQKPDQKCLVTELDSAGCLLRRRFA